MATALLLAAISTGPALLSAAAVLAALAAVLWSAGAAAEVPPGGDGELVVDFSRPLGRFRPLHGVNNGPVTTSSRLDLSGYFKEAAIPLCRLHDVPLAGSWAVDVAAIFPLAHLDPDEPRHYRFDRTDAYIQGIVNVGAGIVYRLGASIEHSPRKFDIHPPNDYDHWARVCVNIIRHYNQGWADGFHHGIRYWEIGNEPDHHEPSPTWTGTAEQFFELYDVTAKAIRRHDPTLMVGGPSVAGNMDFLRRFVGYCRDNGSPLDFCSWHLYTHRPAVALERAALIRGMLDEFGFTSTESHYNEWNYFNADWKRLRTDIAYAQAKFAEIHGPTAAGFAAAMLLELQDSSVTFANYYSGDTLRWGLFTPNYGQPHKTFFAFKAFNQILQTAPQRVACAGGDRTAGPVIGAGLADNGRSACVLACHFEGPARRLRLRLDHLPWSGGAWVELFVLDVDHDLQRAASQPLSADGRLDLEFAGHGCQQVRLTPRP